MIDESGYLDRLAVVQRDRESAVRMMEDARLWASDIGFKGGDAEVMSAYLGELDGEE
ncbi:MAG TPA: hypothetical protein VLH56_08650 [Dissulfurispiraceae bacterium]|nr:hypothetical protein [Dissulfurispiraceae bacterium]